MVINDKFLSTLIVIFFAGGYDERLKENREYLEELRLLSEDKGIKEHVVFLPSCSTEKRDELLATCLCLLYTPTVSTANMLDFFLQISICITHAYAVTLTFVAICV